MTDAASIDSVITTLYEIVSGEAGLQRDWSRNKNLFYPGARSVRTNVDDRGQPWAKSMDPDEFAADAQAFFDTTGFYEVEVARREFRFGNIAHALSVYESRHKPYDPEPFARGINSIQFYNDGQRWWVMSIIWDVERSGNPIPSDLLPDG